MVSILMAYQFFSSLSLAESVSNQSIGMQISSTDRKLL